MKLLNRENQIHYKLNREEFASALRKGQGRAMLHVNQFGIENVKDLILEACLHNQAYDLQLESGRGDWLFEMFRDSPFYSEFREAILNAIEVETDFGSLCQLCRLIYQIAARGDGEAHQKLKAVVYHNAADSTSEADWLGVEDLLSIEGAEGVVGLARIFGQRLIVNPEEFVDDTILHAEKHPEYLQVLSDFSQNEPVINTYREYILERQQYFSSITPQDKETQKQAHHERIRREYSLQSIIEDARNEVGKYPGHYVSFGKHATGEELEEVYTCLLGESSIPVRRRLLWVFRRAKLPRVDELLLDWANSDNGELRADAITALSQVSDPRIHQFAKMKMETSTLLSADNDAIGLFINNFESGDERLIRDALDRIQPNPEDAHSLGYSIRLLADQREDPSLANLLLWVYENTPCAFCRRQAAFWLDRTHQLPDELRFECQYDSDEDTRAFARGNGEN
jgi:hypothetical protein